MFVRHPDINRRHRPFDGVSVACYSGPLPPGRARREPGFGASMRFAVAVVVACLAGLAPAAHATVVALTSLEEMTHRADVVMQAVVTGQKVVEDRPGKIVTLTTFEVLDGISGVKTGDVVTVYQVGGRLGEKQAWIVGAHKFKVGEELIFFGSRMGKRPELIVPWAIGYGLFAVLDDVDGRHVHEIAGDVAALSTDTAGNAKMVGLTPRRFENLDTFKQQLRAILAGENVVDAPALKIVRPVAPAVRQ